MATTALRIGGLALAFALGPVPGLAQSSGVAMFSLFGGVATAPPVHVTASGHDDDSCGSNATPCASLARAIAHAAEGGTIHLGPGTFPGHDLVIDRKLRIEGAGRGVTVIDAQRQGRVVRIEPGATVTLADLTLTGGEVRGGEGGDETTAAEGGAVLNLGRLRLERVAVVDNLVVGATGAAGSAGPDGAGGGVGDAGKDAKCYPNGCPDAAGTGGRGINGAAGGAGGNGAAGGLAAGGGLLNAGDLTLIETLIAGNTAIGGDGGAGGVGGKGGAGGKGGVGGKPDYSGCHRRHGGYGGRGGDGGPGGVGGGGGDGGLARGGGIHSTPEATLVLVRSEAAGNVARTGAPGAGGPGGSGGAAGEGGEKGGGVRWQVCLGTWIEPGDPGAAGSAGPPGSGGPGGAAPDSLGGGATVGGAATFVVSSLVRDNTADAGAGLALSGLGRMVNVTIAGNAGRRVGGLLLRAGEMMILANSIVVANTAPDAEDERTAQLSTVFGELRVHHSCIAGWPGEGVDARGNLADCDPGFVRPPGDAPALADLRLRADSPLIDAGDNAALDLADVAALEGDLLGRDLDGSPRVVDGRLRGETVVDIGAYEYVPGAWPIGVAIVPPAEAIDPDTARPFGPPTITPTELAAALYWDDREGRLYPIAPIESRAVELAWPVTAADRPRDASRADDPDDPYNQRARQRGATIWPEDAQIHVAGAPVDLGTAEGLAFADITHPRALAGPGQGATFEGVPAGEHAVLRFARGPDADLTTYPPAFVVVRSVPVEAVRETSDACVVGRPLQDAGHADPSGRGGFVLDPHAPFDGARTGSAHRRATREGPIVPVAITGAALLEVAWYAEGAAGIAWPSRVVRYDCRLPEDGRRIVIASGRGTGPLDPELFGAPRIYAQPDPDLPGYRPNFEHAWIAGSPDGPVVQALRSDLTPGAWAEPHVLLEYRDPETDALAFEVIRVVAEDKKHRIDRVHERVAGHEILPPAVLQAPAGALACEESFARGPHHLDHRHGIWATVEGDLAVHWFYRLRPGFWYDSDGDGTADAAAGDCVPWLDRHAGTPGEPLGLAYRVAWPEAMREMRVGQTLLDGIRDQGAVTLAHGEALGLRLIDPLSERAVPLEALPDGLAWDPDGALRRLRDLPRHLRQRLAFDPSGQRLSFAGSEGGADSSWLLPNIMTAAERDLLLALDPDPAWGAAVQALFAVSREDLHRDHRLSGPKALDAAAVRATGHVTLIYNDDSELAGSPIGAEVLELVCPVHTAPVHVLPSANLFDEAQTLHYGASFAGEDERLAFEWAWRPAGLPVPTTPDDTWHRLEPGEAGLTLTIQGAGPMTLRDHQVLVRHRGYEEICGEVPGHWSGATAGSDHVDPLPQLAEGWVKRVLARLNRYDPRSRDLLAARVSTVASMVAQAGPRYEANVALVDDPESLGRIGLIEAYETVLRRARRLSIDAPEPQPYDTLEAGGDPLLQITSQIADLYLILGDEAAADAADPTIPVTLVSGETRARTTGLFAFQGQMASLLEEELALLRGRDDIAPGTGDAPAYNRLPWNFLHQGEGLAAYVQTYGIADVVGDGGPDDIGITIEDARHLYPQGHGDAWGHYLTALKRFYDLLRHERYEWRPRAEAVLLDGQPVLVDFEDERRFARAALGRARTGSEVVALTFRSAYQEDDQAALAGYPDRRPGGASGLADWAARAGQGAYLDWVTGNAILPPRHCDLSRPDHAARGCDPDAHDVARIDRGTVSELVELTTAFRTIQQTLDRADEGLNPLGLSREAVSFGLDPDRVANEKVGHFQQVAERAERALVRVRRAFDHAQSQTLLLRSQSESVEGLERALRDREFEHRNRLIQIFGTPYPDDIGPGRTYPAGYEGPDLYHYDYVDDMPDLLGLEGAGGPRLELSLRVRADVSRLFDDRPLLIKDEDAGQPAVSYHDFDPVDPGEQPPLRVDPGVPEAFESGAGRVVTFELLPALAGAAKPQGWTSRRRAPGELQTIRAEMLQAMGQLRQEMLAYDRLLEEIATRARLLESLDEVHQTERDLLEDSHTQLADLRTGIIATFGGHVSADQASSVAERFARAAAEALPKVVGTSNDATSAARAAVLGKAAIVHHALSGIAGGLRIAERNLELMKEEIEARTQFELLAGVGKNHEKKREAAELVLLTRQEPIQRAALFSQYQLLRQHEMRWEAAQAEGQRLVQELIRHRRETTADVQKLRFRDMASRMFREEALRGYRRQFDHAARAVYLAAKAYEYETGGMIEGPEALADLQARIIRQRRVGDLEADEPLPGAPNGLAGTLAELQERFRVFRVSSNYDTLEPEFREFSLRWEHLGIPAGLRADFEDDQAWRLRLESFLVDDVQALALFRACCQPFADHREGPQPGLVIPFATTIEPGRNFFGREELEDASLFTPSRFATRLQAASVVLEGYDASSLGLTRTPYVYLVPVGRDLTRDPRDPWRIRGWQVQDALLPQAAAGDGGTAAAGQRRHAALRAYDDIEFDRFFSIYDRSLIGRSVANTRWLLIIPGIALAGDPHEGLRRLIGDELDPGISDIRLHLKAYSYTAR